MKDLSSRLAALRDSRNKEKKENKSENKETIKNKSLHLPDEWEKAAEYVYKKRKHIKIPDLSDIHPVLAELYPSQNIQNLVFFDLETTGLSGGAGTVVFLAGFGMYSGQRFFIDQLLLTDYPGQAAFFDKCTEYLNKESVIVSYNGKSFDLPLLRSKAAMNGILIQTNSHIDLLHPSRKLWKEIIGACSLSDIEEKVLEIKRDVDIPGKDIPDKYFSFLDSYNYNDLYEVIEHHFQDISTLVKLLHVINRICFGEHVSDFSRFGLARMLLYYEPEKALKLLLGLHREKHIKAGRLLGLYYKKRKDFKSELKIWEQLWVYDKSCFAAVELAKSLEHRERDENAALLVLTELIETSKLNEKQLLLLIHRKDRLKNKIRSKKIL